MKPIRPAIILSMLYIFLYAVLAGIESTWDFALLMFTFSPVVMIWLVVNVLRKGEAPHRKQEDGYYYQDSNIKDRNPL